MKYSFLTFACPQWNFDQVVDAAVNHGYDGVEFRCDAGHSHGVEIYTEKLERRKLRRKLDKANLIPCCLASGMKLISDTVMEEFPLRLELAAELGCPGVRIFCGHPSEDMDEKFVIETVTERLLQAAQLAEGYQLQLWLETHDHFSRAAAAAAVVREVDRPNVGVCYDNMHPLRMGEPLAETRQALHGLIRHVHFHDAMNVPDKVLVKPFGQGQMPIDAMWDLLLDEEYDEFITGEWFNNDYGQDPDEALAAYLREVKEIARKRERPAS